MRILGVSGSNRKNGNSYLLLKEIFSAVPSVETKIVQIAELQIKPCELCFDFCAQKPYECVIEDDFKLLFEEMKSADGIVIACPFYFYVPSKFQAFLERISCLDYSTVEKHGKQFSPFTGKPCLLVTVSASGSSFNAFQILYFLQEFALMLGMKPITVNAWPYIGFSAKSGGINAGAILKEQETINKGREFLKLLVSAINGV
ncbi:MAG: flavodoxin family protein [Candidatus Bathyarchaeota archaeon]|jgi:multimeric flavodoxin WrbA|nr:flavodoxin family protein [Candidatus Bathyarchaeota archaeon A05DMB-5]MDH7557475.1 flavodoxin family protein [Candidatus Bathyarchaeota archaeon]